MAKDSILHITLIASFLLLSNALPEGYELGTYPSTFPYENELYVPPELPAGHKDIYDQEDPMTFNWPSETFDEATDIGGYGARVPRCDPTVWAPYNVVQCGYNKYWGFKVLGESSLPATQFFNCTTRGYDADKALWKAGDFSGKVGTYTSCETAECCTDYYGFNKFNTGTESKENQLGLQFTTGMCKTINEEAYCAIVDDSQHVCIDNFLDKFARKRIESCSDVVIIFFLGCPIFAQEGVIELIKNQEPQSYLATLTPDQSMYIYSFWKCTDRVCYPHSYYHPEDVKASDAPAAAAPAASTPAAAKPAPAPAAEESSSAIRIVSAAALLVTLAGFA